MSGQPKVAEEFNPKAVRYGAYAKLPYGVLTHAALSAPAKCIYGRLQLHADSQTGDCFPGFSELASELNSSTDAVGRWIKELAKERLIKVVRQGNGLPAQIKFLWHPCLEQQPKKRARRGSTSPSEAGTGETESDSAKVPHLVEQSDTANLPDLKTRAETAESRPLKSSDTANVPEQIPHFCGSDAAFLPTLYKEENIEENIGENSFVVVGSSSNPETTTTTDRIFCSKKHEPNTSIDLRKISDEVVATMAIHYYGIGGGPIDFDLRRDLSACFHDEWDALDWIEHFVARWRGRRPNTLGIYLTDARTRWPKNRPEHPNRCQHDARPEYCSKCKEEQIARENGERIRVQRIDTEARVRGWKRISSAESCALCRGYGRTPDEPLIPCTCPAGTVRCERCRGDGWVEQWDERRTVVLGADWCPCLAGDRLKQQRGADHIAEISAAAVAEFEKRRDRERDLERLSRVIIRKSGFVPIRLQIHFSEADATERSRILAALEAGKLPEYEPLEAMR